MKLLFYASVLFTYRIFFAIFFFFMCIRHNSLLINILRVKKKNIHLHYKTLLKLKIAAVELHKKDGEKTCTHMYTHKHKNKKINKKDNFKQSLVFFFFLFFFSLDFRFICRKKERSCNKKERKKERKEGRRKGKETNTWKTVFFFLSFSLEKKI